MRQTHHSPAVQAFALSLGAAIALGIARLSYALLLPAMKADLGWSFAQAGMLNTSNAAGYLLGALLAPALGRRFGSARLFAFSCVATTLLMFVPALVVDTGLLNVQRLITGVTGALIFVSGGVLAAHLASSGTVRKPGFVIGLYYGGVGWGIVLPALVAPLANRPVAHGWQLAWVALGGVSVVLCAFAIGLSRMNERAAPRAAETETETETATTVTSARSPVARQRVEPATGFLTPGEELAATGTALLGGGLAYSSAAPLRQAGMRHLGWALLSYCLFGIGYIGYMTFVVALLRGEGLGGTTITIFYVLLGLGVVISAGVWAPLLDRCRGGEPLALLNVLLAVATLLPVLFAHSLSAYVSGVLFGGTFLSVVAATTALVRHTLPRAAWSRGIGLFTIVFAIGQIIGPTIVGWVADTGGGLTRGFLVSAVILLLAALTGALQRPWPHHARHG